jgi:hypothetical protein
MTHAKPKKVDNAHLGVKLDLRRHFLRRYHQGEGADAARVFDCCQAGGAIWGHLRREFAIASYWGVDVKPKKGRLRIDSARVLGQPGWAENVIDIDTYGSPWAHWFHVLCHAPGPVTVFLTWGVLNRGIVDTSVERLLGMTFKSTVPMSLRQKVGELADRVCVGAAERHGHRIVEAIEARPVEGAGTARYFGVRLEPINFDRAAIVAGAAARADGPRG